jgi:hypothetical protein
VTYLRGGYYRICDVCGFKYRASETTKRWDGLFVCREDFETRHPQDFVRGRIDRQNVPNPRPEPPDVFIGPGEQLMTETGEFLFTEDGAYLEVEV